MNEKNYTDYSTQQLLEDDFFLESFFNPTVESQLFWEELKRTNKALAKEIMCANTILSSIPYRKRILSSDDTDLLWKRISHTTHKKRLFRYWYSSVAAVAVLLLVAGGFYYTDYYVKDSLTAIEKVQKPEYPIESIQLILADEKKVNIEEEDSRLRYSKKGELHINTQKVDIPQKSTDTNKQGQKDPVYNQLIVPAAKRSFLELADGSKIWVNANTRVVYPVTFENKKREIYVDGEIYIEVSPDKERPFIVKSEKMDIRVLGTKFNVSAYATNKESSVVLVSGKVNVHTDNRAESILEPSDRLSYGKGSIDIRKVNVENYIGWKDKLFMFDEEDMVTIMNKLTRWYDVDIIIETPELKEKVFYGVIRKYENISTILDMLKKTQNIDYLIEGKKIVIKEVR